MSNGVLVPGAGVSNTPEMEYQPDQIPQKPLQAQWADFDPVISPKRQIPVPKNPGQFIPRDLLGGRSKNEITCANGQYKAGYCYDVGEKRSYKPDEDSLRVVDIDIQGKKETLMIVADGMGGHDNGRDASQLVVAKIEERYRLLREQGETEEESLSLAIKFGNAELHKVNLEKKSNAGSTVVVAVLRGNKATIAHVGDSRAYKINRDRAEKLTTDHSVVQGLVAAGIINPEDVYTHPKRNQILRSLGEKPDIEVDTSTVDLQSGDQILLCCDGLWEMTGDTDGSVIHSYARSTKDQAEVARRLVALANQEGGVDNIAVIVARYTPENMTPPPMQKEAQSPSYIHELDKVFVRTKGPKGRVEEGVLMEFTEEGKASVLIGKDDHGILITVPLPELHELNVRDFPEVNSLSTLVALLKRKGGLKSSKGHRTPEYLLQQALLFLNGELDERYLTNAEGFRDAVKRLKGIKDAQEAINQVQRRS